MTSNEYNLKFCVLPGQSHNVETTGLFLGNDLVRRAGGEFNSRRGSGCSQTGESSSSNLSHQLGTELMRRGSSCSRIVSECSNLGDIAEDEIRVLQQGAYLLTTYRKNSCEQWQKKGVITNSTEHIPFAEDDQKIPHLLWNLKVYFHIYITPPSLFSVKSSPAQNLIAFRSSSNIS